MEFQVPARGGDGRGGIGGEWRTGGWASRLAGTGRGDEPARPRLASTSLGAQVDDKADRFRAGSNAQMEFDIRCRRQRSTFLAQGKLLVFPAMSARCQT